MRTLVVGWIYGQCVCEWYGCMVGQRVGKWLGGEISGEK